MKKRIVFIIILIVAIAMAFFVLNYRSTNPGRERDKLFMAADSLNIQYAEISGRLNLLSQLVSSLYLSKEYVYDGIIPQNYHVDDTELYKNKNDGLAAVFYTGNIPVGDNLISDVVLMEQLDEYMQQIFISSELIESVFYYDNSEFYRHYPYIEYKPEFRNYNFKDTAEFAEIFKEIKPGKRIWRSTPQLSPFTGEWVISAIKPVIQQTNLLGLCVINISVNKLSQFIESIDSEVGVLSDGGHILHQDNLLRQSLSAPPWLNQQVLPDSLTVNDYSLFNIHNFSLELMAKRIIVKNDFFYSQKLLNTDYLVLSHPIPHMGLYLYTLVYDDGSVAKMKRLRRRINKSRRTRMEEDREKSVTPIQM